MPSNLRRDLGTLESYAALLGILIGAGIFKVTSDAWALTGPSVILGYLVLAPVILATSVAYSVFLSTPLGRAPGGEYTHISRTFGGYGLAFVGAWLKIISYIGALAYLASAFADYVTQLVPGISHMGAAIGSLLFFYAIHVAGVRWFGRLQVWMCALLGVSLVVLIVPGLFAIRAENYRPFFTHGDERVPGQPARRSSSRTRDSSRWRRRRAKCATARAGSRASSSAGSRRRSVIYFLMSVVALGVLSPAQLRVSSAPMADAAARYLPVGAAAIVTLGAIMARGDVTQRDDARSVARGDHAGRGSACAAMGGTGVRADGHADSSDSRSRSPWRSRC